MLRDLLPEVNLSTDVEINGLALDSRQINSGDLFFALSGSRHDGREFIQEAVERNAAAVVYESDANDGQEIDVPIPCIGLANASSKVGEIASRYFGNPSHQMFVIAVTGTNGKTSCSHFISEALMAVNRKCGVIGTMGTGFPGALEASVLTTPNPINLQQALARILAAGGTAVALEASSHGLLQNRLKGTSIDVAILTNLTRDHLDYHSSLAEYRNAKRLLFEWPGLKSAVLNLDDEFGAELAENLDDEVQVLTYSTASTDADVYCEEPIYHADGVRGELVTPWGKCRFQLPLLGDFNLANVLAAAGVLGLMEYRIAEIVHAIQQLRTVRGRMDVLRYANAPTVVIDYAHTPDALEKVIQATRRHCIGNLWCVFGCGGDRDQGKRPLMGEVAERLADYVVLTDDNPRSEPSVKIVNEILEGISDKRKVYVETDRANAIKHALSNASVSDMVLIAGKGHEDYQEISGSRIAYSDYDQVEKYLAGEH
ncbi:MAG: UDP-N-acetylmuramoyl-L-alanyl-D-glutamate--2,6-diaminopimelate ligase [Pseudomonadales bacterium]